MQAAIIPNWTSKLERIRTLTFDGEDHLQSPEPIVYTTIYIALSAWYEKLDKHDLQVASIAIDWLFRTVRTIQQAPVLSCPLAVDNIVRGMVCSYITPNPIRRHKPTLVFSLIWTFQKSRIGKLANAKSETTDMTFQAVDILAVAMKW